MEAWQSGFAARPARTSSSTRTTRSTGGRGPTRRSPRPPSETCRCCCRSATRPVTGATSWPTNRSRTQQTAAIMNEHLVSIKVDREERPDVDSVYMTATQAMTGQGGWPMTVFMTPDREPFFCGTYFPRAQFQRLVLGVSQAWREDREQVASQASQIAAALAERAGQPFAATGTGAETTGRRAEPEARRPAAETTGAEDNRAQGRRARGRLRGRGLRAGAGVRREPRRLRRRAEVPAVDGAGVPAPALRAGRRSGRWPRARDGRGHRGCHGSGRHVRPAGRRLCPVQRGR